MKIIINNALTGETVERDMSAEQEAQHNAAVEAATAAEQVEADRRTQEATDKTSGNQKLLDLGLSQAEVDALTK